MSETSVRQALVKALDENRLVTCKVPGSKDMVIALERHMVDDAITHWDHVDGADKRRAAMESIRREIKRTLKRMQKQKATGAEMDAMAADVALWIGHELLFGDGERYLVKGPDRDTLEVRH